MAPTSQELALHYLLELSSDIRAAVLVDAAGGLVAAAPGSSSQRMGELAGQLSHEAGARFGSAGETVELDAVCDGGAVFLIRWEEGAMACLTNRSVLPGLIFYDMHAILTDLDRAANAEARRARVAER